MTVIVSIFLGAVFGLFFLRSTFTRAIMDEHLPRVSLAYQPSVEVPVSRAKTSRSPSWSTSAAATA